MWYAGTRLGGSAGHAAAKRMVAQVWRSYFLDTRTAPAPGPAWLDGVSAPAKRATDKALLAADGSSVAAGGSLDVPVAVAYGDHDIFGSAAGIVRARFPVAQQITFTGCGHMPWLQVPDQFESAVRGFFAQPGQRR